MSDELEAARRTVDALTNQLARARERVEALERGKHAPPDAVVAFLRELVELEARLPKRRDPYLRAGDFSRWVELLPESFRNAFAAARRVQNRPPYDRLTGGTLGSLVQWICDTYSNTPTLTCDDAMIRAASRGDTWYESTHYVGPYVIERRIDNRLVRFRVEQIASAPSSPSVVVPIDEGARASLRGAAAFLKS